MDNDDQTIGRIFTRREALAAVGTGLALTWVAGLGRVARAAALPAASPATRPASIVACPRLTEGPFFVDERLNRSDLVAGTTRASVARGVPLLLTVGVHRLSTGLAAVATPLAGACVDLWHADAHGVYSDEDDPMNPEVTAGQKWLRGYQLTDPAGGVKFRTILPGWYDGRTPHIHFKVRQFTAAATTTRPTTAPVAATAEFTSQLFFADAEIDRVYARPPYRRRTQESVRNVDDGIYSEPLADGSPAGAQMTLALRDNPAGAGLAAAVTVYLTDASLHAGPEHRPGGGGGPDGPPPDGGFPW